jgi:hypothetical protein
MLRARRNGAVAGLLVAMVAGCSGAEAESANATTEEGLHDGRINKFLLAAQDEDSRAWPILRCRQSPPSAIRTPFTISFYGSSGIGGLPPLVMVVESPNTPWSNSVLHRFDHVNAVAGDHPEITVTFSNSIGTFKVEALTSHAKLITPEGPVDLVCGATSS